ncbi:MAG TPA: HAD family hydrolase [archaeon]|nr:HAD family hydrolase [archaeon]
MKPNLIIFDLDGTLIDTLDAYFEFFNNLLEKWKIPQVTKEFYQKNLFWKNISVEIAEIAGVDKVEEGMKIYKEEFKDYYGKIKLMKNSKETLDELKKTFPLALLTSTVSYGAKGILKQFGMEDYFQMAVFFDDLKKPKPDPEGLLKIMEKFSAKPEETIYVGDSPSDMKAAEAAGCKFIGYGPTEKFSNHKSIQDLYELCELVKK